MEKSIKIFINYHKPARLLKNNIFVPIHIGRDLALQISKDGKLDNKDFNWLLNNMIGDNTGENISSKNRQYCELTGIYWVWKHYQEIGNPDYIGFMTYRRHFIFNSEMYKKIKVYLTQEEITYGDVMLSQKVTDYETKFGISETDINNYCNKYDCILPLAMNLNKMNIKSLEEDYAEVIEGTNINDYKIMVENLKLLFPKYGLIAEQRAKQPDKIGYQMFICKKEIFFDYCNMLFTTLFEIENKIDTSKYSVNGKRTLGYLGELIFDTYFSELIAENKYKIKQLPVTMIIDEKPPIRSKLKHLEYKILKDFAFTSKKRNHYLNKYKNFKKHKTIQGGK